MAALALGAAGGFLFGPLGFLIGSALGNLLFQQKQQGPRLTDLHTQTSAYGEMIPIVYGKMRIATKVIYAADKVEHEQSQKGKGGPEVTTFTYTQSFATYICEGPIADVLRIWFDKQLIWDRDQDGSPALPWTLYYGDMVQTPDATMEALLGVGNVPGYRGTAYIMWEDLELEQWGNRIPDIEVEVLVSAGDIPFRVSTFNPLPDGAVVGGGMFCTFDGTVITAGRYSASIPDYIERYFLVDGTPVGSPPYLQVSLAGLQLKGTVGGSPVAVLFDSGADLLRWYVSGEAGAIIPANPVGGTNKDGAFVGRGNIYQFDYIYGVSTQTTVGPFPDFLVSTIGFITRWPAPGGIPTGVCDATYSMAEVGTINWINITLGTSDTGNVYATVPPESSVIGPALYEFDADLNLLRQWDDANDSPPSNNTPPTLNSAEFSFVVYRGMYGSYSNTGAFGEAFSAVKINSDYTFTHVGQIFQGVGPNIRFSRGLCLCADGVVSLDPPEAGVILGDIVADLSARTKSLDPSEYNTSDLKDLVPGYVIASQTAVRDAISPLQNAWPFDATESSGVIKFVRRGKASIIDIPDDDLAAHTPDSGPPAKLGIKRALEQELPRTVSDKYRSLNADYQDGSQYERRLLTNSVSELTLELPIALSDTFAKTVASVFLFGAWFSRTTFTFWTSCKYAWLEPTDVIGIGIYTMRITKKTEQGNGVIAWEAIADDPSLWARSSAGSGGEGQGSSHPLVPKTPTDLLLLDLPMITDSDEQIGFYAAMASSTGATNWAARLYQSVDGGTSYNIIGARATQDVIGTCVNALGDFTGNNIFDETQKLTILVGAGGGSLASASQTDVLNGANMIVAGPEVLQYCDAELVDVDTWELSRLLRGRRGTEWAINAHAIGERFVMLPVLNPAMSSSLLGRSLLYKAVTVGRTVAQTTAVSFVNQGQSLRPYTPVLLGGGCDASGNITLNWTRRTRVGGEWLDFNEVPLAEASEGYVVQIWDSSYTICARIIDGLTAQTTTYSAADQVTDFGATQQTIYWTVLQKGSYRPSPNALGTAVGAGGSNNNPLVPITPYNGNPIDPPPGPTAPVDGTITWPSYTVVIPMTIGQRKVYQFTTGASIPNTGTIAVSEAASAGTPRRCFIATDTGGINIIPHSLSYGTTATSFIGAGAGGAILAALTTYYYIFDFIGADGTLQGIAGTNAQTHLALGNVT